MTDIIENTEDGLHIYPYDIVYYYDDNCDVKYAFATSHGLKTMTLDESLGEILVKGEDIKDKNFYLSQFSLYKRLIDAGILTSKSYVEYKNAATGPLKELLKRAWTTFETIFTDCRLTMRKVEDDFVFVNQESETVFSIPIYCFLKDLFEEISDATFPKELDWFLVKQFYKAKEGKI